MAAAETRGRRLLKFGALALVLIALVVVPFLLFGEALQALSFRLLDAANSPFAIATIGALLLASDVVLPIPSTVLVAILGGLLGAVGGAIAAVIGLTLGCAIGYWLGRALGHDFALRQLGARDFAYLSALFERHGLPILALCRPVPVLAEASVIAAGVLGLPAARTLAVTLFANVGFAGTYAMLGASAETGLGLILVFALSLAIPALALFIANRVRGEDTSLGDAAAKPQPRDEDRDGGAVT